MFVLFCTALAALVVALIALNKAKDSEAEIAHLKKEVVTLRTELRHLRDRAAAPGARAPAAEARASAAAPPPPPPAPRAEAAATPPPTPHPRPTPAMEPGAEPAPPPEPKPIPVAPAPPPREPARPAVAPPPPAPKPPAAPQPHVPPPPPPAHPPAAAANAWTFDWENLVGVKLFSWIAGVSLVLAAVFFLKYSVEHGWLSPTIRATLGILTGATLLVVCELRVARGYSTTANAMHGAGIAILYATLFAIHALWHLLPATLVFLLMLVVTAVAVGLSIRRDSMFIALLGLMGGFATPALLSTGENRPIGLFSYLLLLNLGLAWVAYRKRWPALTAGSLIFTVLYQWGWVAKYLTAEQLPLAVLIFAAFGATSAAALWLGRREDDEGQTIFDKVALAAAALPLLFGLFAAAIPAYGARYHTLFGFLMLVAGGLAFVGVARRQLWLHTGGGGAVLLTFVIWISRSYTPAAWPLVLVWISAFVILYLLIATTVETEGNLTAPLLFFMLPALVLVEPRTASPLFLFSTFFLLLAGTAYVAIRYRRGLLYFVASFFAILGEAVWSARYLAPERLGSALLLYAAFGLLFLGVPALARRFNRPLEPRSGVPATALLSLGMLFFLTIDSVAGAALWGLSTLLAILLGGTIAEARIERRPHLAAIASVLTWLVLAAWWEGLDLGAMRISALFAVAAFGVIVLLGMLWAARAGDQRDEFGFAAHLAFGANFFLVYLASERALAFPPWPLFAVLAILTLAVGTASLYLRRGSLTIGGAFGAHFVLFAWVSHTLMPPYGNIALAAALAVAAWSVLWLVLAHRVTRDAEVLATYRFAAAAGLLLAHVVAMIAGGSGRPHLFATLLATHAILAVATLVLAWRTENHALSLWSAILTMFATVAAQPQPPARAFTFAAVLYSISAANPLLLGARVKGALHPYLAAVISSVAFFFFARDAMNKAGLGWMIGVLPVGEALVLLALLFRLLRIELPDARDLGRLALVAGAALAFITVAIPLQLDKQWITIGWALEGAALVWLFTRIPHGGLLAWSGALLLAVFARLVFNPAVFLYHPPAERAILNWYLYTYGVCAAAFFAAAYWLPRELKRAADAAAAMGTVLLFVLLNIEIADFYSTGPVLTFNFFSSSLAQELTYTIGWALFAVGMLITGIAIRARGARVAALLLLLATILKCFLHDLARLGGLYRVASLAGLALSLVLVGVLLQKFVMTRPVAPPPAEEPTT